MRNLLRVLLGVFTASLSTTSDVTPLSPRHKARTQKAVLCVRYLTDFILIAQYKVHTPGTIQSMSDYLADFHNHKEVFLRFRASKAVKSSVREASRDLRLNDEMQIEKEELVHDLLTEGAHFNFPKMHLISHFAEQIPKYGSLPQFSTEICESSHKPLKDAYHVLET